MIRNMMMICFLFTLFVPSLSHAAKGAYTLCEAIKKQDRECIRLLINRGANVNQLSKTGGSFTPLHYAAGTVGFSDIVLLLLQKGADPNAKNFLLKTPLHYAAECRSIETIQHLLSYGADKQTTDIELKTPVMYAIESCSKDDVIQLLRYGVNTSMKIKTKTLPLKEESESDEECILDNENLPLQIQMHPCSVRLQHIEKRKKQKDNDCVCVIL